MKKKITTMFSLLIGSIASFTAVNAQTFTYTGALQSITIPSCADSVTIAAYGAQGGGDATDGTGGMGAKIVGTFKVTPGDILDIMVGGQGLDDIYNGFGGGGGSFVWNTSKSDTLMIAAGGGGGAGVDNASSNGGPGSATTIPTSGWASYTAAGGTGGNGGSGGTNGTGSYAGGGGGAGWYSNGADGQVGSLSNPAGTGGITPLAGGAGGTAAANWGANGGYGGGGGSGIDGGGGGGYNGGGGSNAYPISGTSGSGGGGGSFNGGLNQVNVAGFQSGDGMVVITFIDIVPKVSPIVGPDSVCTGSTFTFSCDSVSGGSYTWTVPAGATINSGQGTDTINVTFAGNTGMVKVSVTSTCGSASDSMKVVVSALPSLTITTAMDTPCVSMTMDSLIGSPSGGTFSGAGVSGSNFNPSAAGTGVHTILYTYTNVMGCTNTDSMNIVVSSCTGIKEVKGLAGEVNIYPNPFSQTLNVAVSTNEVTEATMYDMLGNKVGTWQLKKGLNELNTQTIPTGVYSLQLKSASGILTREFVKVN